MSPLTSRKHLDVGFLELALVLVRFDHVASPIINANHGIV